MNTRHTATRLLSFTLAAVLTLSVMLGLDTLAAPDTAATQLAHAHAASRV
jgi:hypothetical protein